LGIENAQTDKNMKTVKFQIRSVLLTYSQIALSFGTIVARQMHRFYWKNNELK
jgi:hypothetical protein